MDSAFSWGVLVVLAIVGLCWLALKASKEEERRSRQSEYEWAKLETEWAKNETGRRK